MSWGYLLRSVFKRKSANKREDNFLNFYRFRGF